MRVSTQQFCKLISMSLMILFIFGCAEVSAQDNKDQPVTLMVGEEGPDGCELLGKVKGSSKENETGEDNSPYIERLMRARNHLLHEAQKLGGNTVHIVYSNNSGKYEIPGADKEIFHVGNVYRCD